VKKVEIFDPAMCCSTGVCGPAVDPELLRVATVVNTLERQGAKIKRYNAASEPQAFVNNKTVSSILEKEGADVLPITLLDGVTVKTREYPTNDEFSSWSGIKISGKPDGDCCCCSDSSKCC
jgi:hypothetical protein